MARTYKRDARGRFSGGGSTGRGRNSPGAKASKTKRTNAARAAELRAKGITGMGARLKAKGFVGGKAAQKRAGGLRRNETISGPRQLGVVRPGQGGGNSKKRISGASLPGVVSRSGSLSGSRRAANQKTSRAIRKAKSNASKAGQRGKSLARTDKKSANPAQARYKELSKRIRAGKRYSDSNMSRSGFGSGADAAGARRSKAAMERRRR